MKSRLDLTQVSSGALNAMLGLEACIAKSGIERPLMELVRMRASQINGCAYCLDMHSKDARAAGETEQRLYALDAWRETPFYSARERAALAWTEALTLLSSSGAPDEDYEELAREFDPSEQVALTLAIVAINGWNRLGVGFRSPVGGYVSHLHPEPDDVR